MKTPKLAVVAISVLAGYATFLSTSASGQSLKGQTTKQVNASPFGQLIHNHIGDLKAINARDIKSDEAIDRADALLKAGDLTGAISTYKEALAIAPSNGLAYQKLAETEATAGKLSEAAATYRKLLYKWPGKDWSSNFNGDPSVHMRFALVLLRLNQRDEALSVYQRGYQLLQSENAATATTPARGPLPAIIASTDFTAAQFEAAATAVTAVHEYDWVSRDLALSDFQHAASLQPYLALPHFYLGQIYKGKRGFATESIAEFDKASQLGGPEMKPFVDKAMKDGSAEFTAAVKKANLATE